MCRTFEGLRSLPVVGRWGVLGSLKLIILIKCGVYFSARMEEALGGCVAWNGALDEGLWRRGPLHRDGTGAVPMAVC